MADRDRSHRMPLPPGAPVEVRCRYNDSWAGGFEVAGRLEVPSDVAYRVRRVSDGVELPASFPPEEVRPSENAATASRE